MGQTQSQQQQNNLSDVYSAYIQKQQDLIYQQQKQINSLYQHNLQSNQSVPPNMLFQEGNQEVKQRLALPSGKLDPYQILGFSKQFDEKMLKKAYLKVAMKTHPDRGGSADAFQRVSIAYALLTKKLKEEKPELSHHDMKSGAREYVSQQDALPKRNKSMKDNFDVNIFNKIYSENKINDAYDEGYGSWMEKNQLEDKTQGKLFQNGFNKDMFNSAFDEYKRSQNKHKGELVQYKDPEVRLSMSNQDSLCLLGQGKVKDFSGEAGSMGFTDYKKAYTDGSTLIDIHSVSMQDRPNSINSIKSQRSRISYTMSQEDMQRAALEKAREEMNEQNRINRLQVYDQKHSAAYEKIHGLLLN